jgi:hypothetical protein
MAYKTEGSKFMRRLVSKQKLEDEVRIPHTGQHRPCGDRSEASVILAAPFAFTPGRIPRPSLL